MEAETWPGYPATDRFKNNPDGSLTPLPPSFAQPNQERSSSDDRRVAALKCESAHVTLWPVDLEPYPTHCPCRVNQNDGLCRQRVHDTGARFTREEATNA